MTQRSRFFDSVGGDRVYSSDAWAQVIGALMGDGVVAGAGQELQVYENGPVAMNVVVGLGKAFVQGYYFELFGAPESFGIAAAHASLPRIDRIVVRRDLANRTASIAVVGGTAAASPTAPALTQNVSGIYEIPLAQVRVNAGVTSINNSNITDERGTRAQGSDIAGILLGTTGHAHTGVNGQGQKVNYTNLVGVPSSFTPSTHDHGAVGGNVPWANISGKPATFAPSAHAHASGSPEGQVPWGNISSKPSTFAPTDHTHAGAGTGGLVPWASISGAPSMWERASAGGGAAGVKVWVGTTTPSTGVTEGDIWVKG